jgi:hypothetical protein
MVDKNIWYSTDDEWYYDGSGGGNSLATWNAKSYVTDDLNFDPLFTDAANNDFTLLSGSPARDAGVDVGLTTDFLGNPIFNILPDIGAYELQTSAGYQTRYKIFIQIFGDTQDIKEN